jgi:hypothetical protein
MFVFDGHRIAGIYPTGFTERTMEEFMPRMQAFMAWASEHRSDDIEQVLPDGRFVYTPAGPPGLVGVRTTRFRTRPLGRGRAANPLPLPC